jgi:hypothetical protein
MKKSLPSLSEWHCNELASSPKHAPEYVAKRDAQLAVLDGLSHEEREFVTQAFNFGLALTLVRQYYGRLDEAGEVLEAERQALQLKRLGSITLNLGLRRH